MPLCSAACVDFHPMLTLAKHPTRTMTVPKKKNNPHSLKQTQNTFMTVFCRFVTSCIVTCQISHYGIWENSQNPNPTYSKYHLLVLSCHSSVPMAHWKSSNNLPPSLFFHSLCIRSSLHSTRPHRPFLGPLAAAFGSIHGGARGEELLHRGGVATVSRPVQRCPTSGAEGLGDVNGWRSPPRGSPPPTPTAVGETAICGVKSVSFIFFKIV